MKFFEIRKIHKSEHEIGYNLLLYSAECRKDDFMVYTHPSIGNFMFSMSDCTLIEYYQTNSTDGAVHGKIYFDSKVSYSGAGTPKEFARNFAVISPIPSFELEYVLKHLLSGGWMQIFRDNRTYLRFFEDTMPGQDQGYYQAEIKCISEDGDSHMEYFDGFFHNDEEARAWVLAQSPKRISELDKSPAYAKFTQSFIQGIGNWMTKGMPFVSVFSISKEDFCWTVSSVTAKHLLELVCPAAPEAVQNV